MTYKKAEPEVITIVTSFATPYSTEQTLEKRVVYGEEDILAERKQRDEELKVVVIQNEDNFRRADKEKKRADKLQRELDLQIYGRKSEAKGATRLINQLEREKKRAEKAKALLKRVMHYLTKGGTLRVEPFSTEYERMEDAE